MTYNVFSGTLNSTQSINHFVLVVCNKNVCALHRLQEITTFIAFVTARDLEKAFSFNATFRAT